MHAKIPTVIIFAFLMVCFTAGTAAGLELQTRYATIEYESAGALRKFNRKLHMGSLGYLLSGKKNETVEDEVRNKIDVIVEKVQKVLDIYPDDMKFKIVIRESTKGVQEEFERIYHIKVNYLAFYSPVEDTVFYSAKNITLRVVAHEIGHVVAEKYFVVSPSVTIHEMLAQYAERHITD
jgi:hypothetical protein